MSTLIGQVVICGYCNSYHTGICPRIESIEYHPNGSVKSIRFKDRGVSGPRSCPRSPNPCFCDGQCMGRAPSTGVYTKNGYATGGNIG